MRNAVAFCFGLVLLSACASRPESVKAATDPATPDAKGTEEGRSATRPSMTAVDDASTTEAKPDPEKVAAEILAGIKTVSPTEHTMTRRALELFVEHQLARQVRVVPEKSGIRLFGIRPDSVPGLLGAENGDRLVSINGSPIASVEQLIESSGQVQTAASIELVLQRAGKPVKLVIRLTD